MSPLPPSPSFDEAGEQRHRLLRHDRERAAADAVTTGAQFADDRAVGRDQAAVVVAHVETEAALAEVVLDRIRG